MYADPYPHLPHPQARMAEGWWRCERQRFYFGVFESSSRFALPLSFPPNLNWQLCHSQRTHSPVSPEAPPVEFSSHLSFLGMWWRQQLCPNLNWRYHTNRTGKFQPPPKVTLLPYYSFISSEWWIMMMLLPYFVCCGNQAHAWIAHSVAFHLCAGSLLTDVLAPAVHLKADPNSASYQCSSANCMQMSGLPPVHNLRRFVHYRVFSRRLLS